MDGRTMDSGATLSDVDAYSQLSACGDDELRRAAFHPKRQISNSYVL